MKIRTIFLFIIMAVLLVSCGTVQPPEGIPLDDAAGFLNWLADPAGGGWLIVVFLVSWGFEYVAFWHKIKPWARQAIMLTFAGLIAMGAQWLLDSPEVFNMIEPYLTPVLRFVAVLLATEAAHRLDKGANGKTTGKVSALK